MKPPVKKTKVGTTKRSDGSQQWESQDFRAGKTKLPDNAPMSKRLKVAKALGTASAQAFIHTGAKSEAIKVQARTMVKKGRKHGAGK